MGQLRPGDTPPDPESAARFAAEFWRRIHTPPVDVRSEADYLKLEAERAYNAAVAAGRTPRPRSPSPVPAPPPEEKTTCLRKNVAPESSSTPPSPSPASTATDLSGGELQRLEQMAAADREILDQRRLLRTTPAFKPRT